MIKRRMRRVRCGHIRWIENLCIDSYVLVFRFKFNMFYVDIIVCVNISALNWWSLQCA